MKLEPHLPQLPSIGELLEHPRVKSVVARINRSTIAQRASGFLDELRSSLVERAGRVEIPSVSQLAERLARRLLGESVVSGPIINATGVVVGNPELVPPLADSAVHAVMHVASDYHGGSLALRKPAEAALSELSGAEAALAVNNIEGALTLLFSTLANNRELLVCELKESGADSFDWRRIAARSGAVLRTCIADPAAVSTAVAAEPRPAVIVRAPETGDLLKLNELSSVAASCEACVVDVAPFAGLLDPKAYGYESIETLSERLAAGADLVVAEGAGLLGGPSCGLILGKRNLLDAITSHPLASLLTVSAETAAALHATLLAYKNDKEQCVVFAVPVWQLLSAPRANWQQRAERISALMAATPGVASAEAREIRSPWRAGAAPSAAATSVAIAIRARSSDASALVARLQQQSYPVVAAQFEDEVHLDLRSVFPRWDQQLVAAVAEATA